MTRGVGRPDVSRVAVRVVIGVLLIVIAAEVYVGLTNPLGILRVWGGDYALYMTATHRWLTGGPFYEPWQFAPYDVNFIPGDRGATAILYPPIAPVIFAPFTFLPALAWWGFGLGMFAYALWRHRPTLWGWAGVLACLAFPNTLNMIANGNPTLLVFGLVSAATVWYWPGALVLLKPTFAPFALFGIWRRSWWLCAGLLVLVSVPLLPMWADYLAVLQNARGPVVGPLYSLSGFPTLLAPVIAWAAATSRPAA